MGRRALEEYLKMVDNGKLSFANEEESDMFVREFENSNDTVKAFITQEDMFPEDSPLMFKRTQFMEMYKSYCSENLVTPVGKREFYAELTSKYNFYVKVINGNYYLCRDPKTNNN